ncbi:hypothetical protein DFH09DRAFT_1327552 [Mycena vulgaris]|nr:hypothetical protein DFH09DRAFT_1327552 [Mycena vulgaris]
MTTYEASAPPAYNPDQGQDKDADPAAKAVGKEPRYVYYRVYAPDGAIPSRTAPDPENPYIGRIKATSVPPPLNVTSLKRCLAHAELAQNPSDQRITLYRLPSDENPMEVAEKLSILGIGIAATPATGLSLVLAEKPSGRQLDAMPLIETILSGVPQYVYYHLHTPNGEDSSVRAFDPDEPAIGRIDQRIIAPPVNVLALKRCIARIEGKPHYTSANLYADVYDERPQPNAARIIVGTDFRGSRAEDALRIVGPDW